VIGTLTALIARCEQNGISIPAQLGPQSEYTVARGDYRFVKPPYTPKTLLRLHAELTKTFKEAPENVRKRLQTELDALQEEVVHLGEITQMTTYLLSRIKDDYALVSEATEEAALTDMDLDFRHYKCKIGRDHDVQKIHKWGKVLTLAGEKESGLATLAHGSGAGS
jgi:hypothetical protein